MAQEFASKPVEDSIARVNNEVAVGEDLEFQRKWWRFENVAWIVFSFIIVLDLSGAFGRGPLAKAERHSANGMFDLHYERIERTESPSILTVNFGPSAIHDGKIRMFVSESVVKSLGAQRIVPEPLATTIGDAGLTYTFSASKPPATVDLALQPAHPGLYNFTLGVEGAPPVQAKVFVVP
jgi:hypothetical protein